jgi:SAM-dependent methyltransferase
VVYQHPLAYLLGLEGVALLRAFAGEYDREFTEARLAEIRALLDAADEFGDGVAATPVATRDVYRGWAPFYDEPGNALIDDEQPIVREILSGLEPGVAVDAACGTGRHAAYLAELGHRVIGVDESPEMLDVARSKVPAGEFHRADLYALPLPDGIADVVVCALALSHVDDLDAAAEELARVLKPGGHLVISDGRPLINDIGLPFVREQPDGTVGYSPNAMRLTSEYLNAALALGLEVRRCVEPRRPDPFVDDTGTPPGDPQPIERYVAGEVPDIWSLHPWSPAATNAAYRATPRLIVWHFQRPI